AKMFCPDHPDAEMGELEPRLFSFNAPQGACNKCHGLGIHTELDESLVVPDPAKSLADGAIAGWNKPHEAFWYKRALKKHGPRLGINLNTAWSKLPDKARQVLLYGEPGTQGKWGWRGKGGFPGGIADLLHRFNNSESDSVKQWVMKFMAERECPSCHGSRLNPFASAVTVGGKRVHEIAVMNVSDARAWVESLGAARESGIGNRESKRR